MGPWGRFTSGCSFPCYYTGARASVRLRAPRKKRVSSTRPRCAASPPMRISRQCASPAAASYRAWCDKDVARGLAGCPPERAAVIACHTNAQLDCAAAAGAIVDGRESPRREIQLAALDSCLGSSGSGGSGFGGAGGSGGTASCTQPTCAGCATCFEVCFCRTSDAYNCTRACGSGGTGGAGFGGASGTAGSAVGGVGGVGFGARAARPAAPWAALAESGSVARAARPAAPWAALAESGSVARAARPATRRVARAAWAERDSAVPPARAAGRAIPRSAPTPHPARPAASPPTAPAGRISATAASITWRRMTHAVVGATTRLNGRSSCSTEDLFTGRWKGGKGLGAAAGDLPGPLGSRARGRRRLLRSVRNPTPPSILPFFPPSCDLRGLRFDHEAARRR